MTREEIIKLAREAGFVDASFCRWSAYSDDLERFAALVAAAEREACAITCEQTTAAWTQHLYNEGVMDCVKAIRARGNK